MKDLKEFYNTNENFRTYIDQMRRIHPEVSVEEVLEKKIVKEVAKAYEDE